ncbi:MAG: DUF6036 family nucleotidyltransferase [Acidimicrobiales bacterium]
MRPILDVVIEIHDALESVGVGHAFGGAFALLWCTGEPRTTIDIDVNVFAAPTAAKDIVGSLPAGVVASNSDVEALERDGQVRLYMDEIPLDLFFNTSPFHSEIQLRTIQHELAGRNLPFLSCSDLAVFKAFFNRRRDWADIEEMLRVDTIDVPRVTGVLAHYLGPDDERIRQLDDIRQEVDKEAKDQ